MSGKSKFTMPPKATQAAEDWVAAGAAPNAPETARKPPAKPTGGKTARLTIDLQAELHGRFKAACAIKGTRMVEVVSQFIEEWTQKNG